MKAFKANNNEVVGGSDSRTNQTVVNLSNQSNNNKSRNLTHVPNIIAIREPIFLIPDIKKAFNYLRLAFIKTLILQYFDLKKHIQTKTNASSYAIGGVLS